MKTISSWRRMIQHLQVALCSALFCFSFTTAEEVNSKNHSTTIEIFNGKDLTGWKTVGGNGKFKVVDGCIVGHGKNINANTFLRTIETYHDFEVSFEFKFIDRTGNSGFMFRANQKPSKNGNGQVFGYQCEADNTSRSWTAGLYDEARRGWLFPSKKKGNDNAKYRAIFTTQGSSTFNWNGWNTIKIRCRENHIQTWLNGKKRVDFKDSHKTYDTREGFFGLQVHGGKSCHVSWRNLKLIKLPNSKKMHADSN